MAAKLIAHDRVSAGFETTIRSTGEGPEKSWNLWWNITLSDDPTTWDDEVRDINRMQDRLGGLHPGQRLVRAHIAEFCREHPLFPQSIDVLCAEIGAGGLSRPVKIGCEGRGLLDSLEHHTTYSLLRQHYAILRLYHDGLERWLAGEPPANATEAKVLHWLGPITRDKGTFVGRILVVLQSPDPSRSAIRGLCREQCHGIRGTALLDKLARPFHCFDCRDSDPDRGQCPCCWGMFLDGALMCTGSAHEETPQARQTFIEEHVMAYSMAVSEWLKETGPASITWPIEGEYVTEDGFRATAEKVQTSLGPRNAVKEWLASCLLKTLRDNQRWHGRPEG